MRKVFVAFGALAAALAPGISRAGVFDIPHFVDSGDFKIGLVPEVTFQHPSGVGMNFKYTHGISDVFNLQGVIGTGGGTKQFRVGSALTFDAFPDTDAQPGLGIAVQAIYLRRFEEKGELEVSLVPYLHKTFTTGSSAFDPFVAFPIGWAVESETTRSRMTLAVGSMFNANDSVRYVVEMGVNVKNSASYFSGGIVYFH